MDQQKAFEQAVNDADLPNFDPNFQEAYERLQRESRANIQHTWRQQGPHLVCTSCPHQHAQWVGMDKKLVGFTKKGEPILE